MTSRATPTPDTLRVLVTGARGQLGSDLVRAAGDRGIAATGLGSAELDVTDGAAVRTAVARLSAQGPGRLVVINAAAHTAVDAAETDVDAAYAINENGARNLAEAAADSGAGLIHVSTDYVFPGDGNRPYRADDRTGPRSVYGASKLAGERAVLQAHPAATVVRTAWVYGAAGNNFVKTMAKLEATHPTITVVDDQQGSPTWSADLAAGLLQLAAERPAVPGGVLHATGGGDTTWWGLARAVFEELGADPERVLPTTSDLFVRPAPRPAYSVLSGAEWVAAGLTPLPHWRQALATAFAASGSQFRPQA